MFRQPSSFALILANLVPLIGVLVLQWDVLTILLLYWTESVVVGVVNVLRMITCRPSESTGRSRFFLIPFFAVHYGIFCYGHLMAVIGFFTDPDPNLGTTDSLAELWQPSFWIVVAAIAGSHLFSFFSNFIGKDERQRTTPSMLMQRPYGRIVVMQIAIVVGAGLVNLFGSPLPLLLVLIGAKTVLDLKLHEKERRKLGLR